MPPVGGPSPMTMGGPDAAKRINAEVAVCWTHGSRHVAGRSPPGQGAGHEAAAMADIKSVIPTLLKAVNAFPVGDKRRQALMQSITRLEANFGKSSDDDIMPAAAQRTAAAAKPGMGLSGHNMPPPGMALGGPSPMAALRLVVAVVAEWPRCWR